MSRWSARAVARLEAERTRSADTHLLRLELPGLKGVQIYLKDESTHLTGSLKHRLARSLFLYGICNGWIGEGTTVIEASSGSTAVSEAYFARLLGLPFVAVMPRGTSPEKIAQIALYGGRCHLVDDSSKVVGEAARLAGELKGHFMDQFTYAERATDWRGNNNIAQSIFEQMVHEPHPIPEWLVCGAGTGGTSATLGRYARYRGHASRVCVVDPENSVFHDAFQTGDRGLTLARGSRIEGIGRPRVEPSFVPGVIDRTIKVPDAASVAAVRVLETLIGRKCGGSTGTNFCGAFRLAAEMKAQGREGSIVTLICDSGLRYLHTYYNDEWVRAQDLDLAPHRRALERFIERGDGLIG